MRMGSAKIVFILVKNNRESENALYRKEALECISTLSQKRKECA